jgi:hypothetical protein
MAKINKRRKVLSLNNTQIDESSLFTYILLGVIYAID